MVSVDLNSVHAIFVSMHALAAAISLISGLVVISSRKHLRDRQLFSVYLWSLVGMVGFLAGALLVWRTVYTGTERIAFSGLFVLAVYMLYRAFRARGLLEARQNDWMREYIHHIGFTLIALFEGFIIVTLIDLRTAGWIIALVAILGVVVGRRAITMAEAKHAG